MSVRDSDPQTIEELRAAITQLEAAHTQPLPQPPARLGLFRVQLPGGRWLARTPGVYYVGTGGGAPTTDRQHAAVWRRLGDAIAVSAGWNGAVIVDGRDQPVRLLTAEERAWRRSYNIRAARLAALRRRLRRLEAAAARAARPTPPRRYGRGQYIVFTDAPLPEVERHSMDATAPGGWLQPDGSWDHHALAEARVFVNYGDAARVARRVGGGVYRAETGAPLDED